MSLKEFPVSGKYEEEEKIFQPEEGFERDQVDVDKLNEFFYLNRDLDRR